MITVAKFIAKYLINKKIKNVPIFQGGAIMNTINEIGKEKKLDYFCPYHEQALAMEVDSMSRIENKANVGFVTSGPGATNLITGVCCSYYDSIPSVYFTGQVGQIHITKKNTVRQRGFQETDVVSLFKPITKYCTQLNDPSKIKYESDKAFYYAETGRPGPCLIDLPYNIQISKINPKKLLGYKPKKKFRKTNLTKQVKSLMRSLEKNKKILIIAGGGIRLSNQINEFEKFIKKTKFPFVTTWAAQDICDHSNDNFYGSIGRHAYKSANKIAQSADLILTLGVRFSPKILTKKFGQNAKIISVDIDKKEMDHALFKIHQKIHCDLKNFFKEIDKYVYENNNGNNWNLFCNEIKNNFFYNNNVKYRNKNFVDPYNFIKIFSKEINNDSIIYTDAGCNLCWCMQAFEVKKGQRLISSWGNSPMGYSVAAGIGGYISSKTKPIYSLIGDGSLMINVQELQFIKKNKVNLKIIVFDNKIYGNTQVGSIALFGNSSYGNDKKNGYHSPDVKKIAKSYEIEYLHAKNNNNLEMKIKNFLNFKNAAILHLNISSKQTLLDFTDE